MILSKKAADKKAQQRIQNVMDQLLAYEAGDVTEIHCPYCGGINSPLRELFCCELFAKTSIAALERIRVEQSTEVVRKVAERHSKN